MKKTIPILAFASLSLFTNAQLSESFEPVAGQSISIKQLLEQQNWQFPDFDINPEGVTPINGLQSIGSVSPGYDNKQLSGVVTPYLSFSNNEELSFSYKLHRALMSGCRRWFLINLVDQNDVVTLIDSVEINGNQVSSVTYTLNINGYPGIYAIYANVRGEGCNAKLAIDDVYFSGTLAGVGGKPNLKNEATTGLNTPKLPEASVNVYPNPVPDNLQVSVLANQAGEAQFEVFAADGSRLLSHSHTLYSGANQITLNTDKLPAGHYVLTIRTAEGVSNKRFVKIG
ncbi:MAG: T9SS type A sorting domain-containing protein [Chitinophagales bacterium]|nr:T9SS type A sorting domain-containing protein [Chitinophagales bacterium]MDW8419039.1 T9SS type A sorting domain-containing protein [Chitinophagales bacterium]